MKYLITIGLFISCGLSANTYAAPCLGAVEKQKIQKAFADDDYWTESFPQGKLDPKQRDYNNLVDCRKKSSQLAKHICGNEELTLLANLVLRFEVYQWSNAVKLDVNASFVTETQDTWRARYESSSNQPSSQLSNLCYDLKEAATSTGGQTIFYSLEGKKPEPSSYSAYYYHGNKHGFVIHSAYNNVLYLGNQCNALDSKDNTGYWLFDTKSNELEIILNGNKKTLGKPELEHRNAFRICAGAEKNF